MTPTLIVLLGIAKSAVPTRWCTSSWNQSDWEADHPPLRDLYRAFESCIVSVRKTNRIIFVPESKTVEGRRMIPMSDRAYEVPPRDTLSPVHRNAMILPQPTLRQAD